VRPQPGAGVLLIEVDDEWRELLADALTASGHAVHQVSWSTDGIELAVIVTEPDSLGRAETVAREVLPRFRD
jgi:hypothetical protein